MNDPEPYRLLLTLENATEEELKFGIPADRLKIEFGPQHKRQPHPEDQLEERWEQECSANPRIFDGSKFRLHSIAWAGDRSSVSICLGLTGYKEYLGTNRLDVETRRKLEVDGAQGHGDPSAHLSNALGCEAVLVTADSKVVLLQRSKAVATHVGLFNGPSGHPEPSRAGIDDVNAALADASSQIIHELFDSIVQETHEETNIPRAELGVPLLIGCMADATGKPDLLFRLDTSLNASEVHDCYSRGGTESWESERILLLHVEEVDRVNHLLTSVTRAAMACFSLCATSKFAACYP